MSWLCHQPICDASLCWVGPLWVSLCERPLGLWAKWAPSFKTAQHALHPLRSCRLAVALDQRLQQAAEEQGAALDALRELFSSTLSQVIGSVADQFDAVQHALDEAISGRAEVRCRGVMTWGFVLLKERGCKGCGGLPAAVSRKGEV